MAKISARGDSVSLIWHLPNGGKIVLTKQGRLLRKYNAQGGYALLKKSVDVPTATAYANATQRTYSL